MKKKTLSKILALGLVSVMTAGMLSGCGGDTADTGADTGSAGTEAAAGEAAAAPSASRGQSFQRRGAHPDLVDLRRNACR